MENFKLLDCVNSYNCETVRELLQNVEVEAYESNTKNTFLISIEDFETIEGYYYQFINDNDLHELDIYEIKDELDKHLNDRLNELKELNDPSKQLRMYDIIKEIKHAIIYTYFID